MLTAYHIESDGLHPAYILFRCIHPAGASARSRERLWPAGEPYVPLKDSMKSHASFSYCMPLRR